MTHGGQYCVVLNNQHSTRIDEFEARCTRDSSARVIFQPYTDKHLRTVKQVTEESTSPVRLFLVEGQYGIQVTAAGILRAIEFRTDLTETDLEHTRSLKMSSDHEVYATNLLYASSIQRLAIPIHLSRFVKRSNDSPLKPGKWPAVICLALRDAPDLNEDTFTSSTDDMLDGVEGHLRTRLIKHRRREHRLRSAKINQMLADKGTLKCEVTDCGFEFTRMYGSLGANFAHVHHLEPLATRDEPSKTSLTQLAIVCANCHSMIHRNGMCRPLHEITTAIRTKT